MEETTNDKKGLEVSKPDNSQVQVLDLTKPDLTKKDLTQLEKAMTDGEALPVELIPNYWSPENPGEVKKLIFHSITTEKYASQQDGGEVVELETANFTEVKDGQITAVKNASWKLVKAVQMFAPGSILQVAYLGKKKNKVNQNMSDQWSVKPLMIKL